MRIGRQGMHAVRAAVLAATALAFGVGPTVAVALAQTRGAAQTSAPAGRSPAGHAPATRTPAGHGLSGMKPGSSTSAETVYFADPRQAPVQVMRGSRDPAAPAAVRSPAAKPVPIPAAGSISGQTTARVETVSFGTGFAERVTVLRGTALAPAGLALANPPGGSAAGTRVEKISFADSSLPAVTVMRGIVARDAFSADLFGPANGGELDRIAFAVDGVESRHGADLRMWRPEFAGPQGPMQVSAAAAFDVGGGDRFDLRQNRLLGRAYLAQMFRRYGNWPDALAAYNWGPGNLDQWIAAGRNAEKLPLETARYITRVLRDALIAGPAARL